MNFTFTAVTFTFTNFLQFGIIKVYYFSTFPPQKIYLYLQKLENIFKKWNETDTWLYFRTVERVLFLQNASLILRVIQLWLAIIQFLAAMLFQKGDMNQKSFFCDT